MNRTPNNRTQTNGRPQGNEDVESAPAESPLPASTARPAAKSPRPPRVTTAQGNVGLKRQLKSYLRNLVAGIDKGHKVVGVTLKTESESDLEKFVRVGQKRDATLLRLLGYDERTANDHPVKKTVIGHTQYAPDYVLDQGQNPLAILELKGPDEKLDNWTGQVLSYCKEIKAPLGLLFNGRSLRVFINTQHEQLLEHDDLFGKQPVAEVGYENLQDMVNLFSKFSAESLKTNSLSVAKDLAEKRARWLIILEILSKNLSPAASDDTVAHLAQAPHLWNEINPAPTRTELISVWRGRKPTKNGGIGPVNPRMREKIR